MKDFTNATLKDEQDYYRKMARAQAGMKYHKKMSDFYSSLRGVINKLPESMGDTVKSAAKKVLKKIK